MFAFIDKLKSALLPPALILIGVGLVYAGVAESRKLKAIADHGKSAVAEIDTVRWKEKRLSGTEKSFKIDVHFLDDKQQTITTQLTVPKDVGQRLRDGSEHTVQVKYLPESPATVVLSGQDDASNLLLLGGAAAVLAGVGIFGWRLTRRGR